VTLWHDGLFGTKQKHRLIKCILFLYLYWLPAKPLAGAHGTLRFCGTLVNNHCTRLRRKLQGSRFMEASKVTIFSMFSHESVCLYWYLAFVWWLVVIFIYVFPFLPVVLLYCCLVTNAIPRRLRSAETRTLLVSRTRTNVGDSECSADGPRVWNYLLTDLKQPDLSHSHFKQSLKTSSLSQHDQIAVWIPL